MKPLASIANQLRLELGKQRRDNETLKSLNAELAKHGDMLAKGEISADDWRLAKLKYGVSDE